MGRFTCDADKTVIFWEVNTTVLLGVIIVAVDKVICITVMSVDDAFGEMCKADVMSYNEVVPS